MGKVKKKSSEHREAVYDLTEDLNHLVSREHQILQDELGQVSTLVGDAIKILAKSFNNLNQQVAEQVSLVRSIADEVSDSQDPASGDQGVAGLDRIADISQQINQNVASAVRSLQFDDIVQQLVIHSQRRAEQMEQLFADLHEKILVLKAVDPQNATQITENLEAMQEAISQSRFALDKTNPVKQTSMGTGEVELF